MVKRLFLWLHFLLLVTCAEIRPKQRCVYAVPQGTFDEKIDIGYFS